MEFCGSPFFVHCAGDDLHRLQDHIKNVFKRLRGVNVIWKQDFQRRCRSRDISGRCKQTYAHTGVVLEWLEKRGLLVKVKRLGMWGKKETGEQLVWDYGHVTCWSLLPSLCISGPTLQQIVYKKVYPNSEASLSDMFTAIFDHLQLPYTEAFNDEEIE